MSETDMKLPQSGYLLARSLSLQVADIGELEFGDGGSRDFLHQFQPGS